MLGKIQPGSLKPLKWFKMFCELEVKSPLLSARPHQAHAQLYVSSMGFATAGRDPLERLRVGEAGREGRVFPKQAVPCQRAKESVWLYSQKQTQKVPTRSPLSPGTQLDSGHLSAFC